MVPEGERLADLTGDQVSDADVDDLFRSVLLLRQAGIAHGALSPSTVVLTADGPLLRNFRRAPPRRHQPAARTRTWPPPSLRRPSLWGPNGPRRAACRMFDPPSVQALLTSMQRSTIDPVTEHMSHSQKGFLKSLRESVAVQAGVEVPKLVETKRISWPNLLMVIGSLIGLWLIIGVLTNASGSLSVSAAPRGTWVALAFVLAQLPVVAGAWALTGAVTGVIPFGRCVVLETSNLFTSFVGGDAAVFAGSRPGSSSGREGILNPPSVRARSPARQAGS